MSEYRSLKKPFSAWFSIPCVLAMTPAWLMCCMAVNKTLHPNVRYGDDGVLFMGIMFGMISSPVVWGVGYYLFRFKVGRFAIWLVDTTSVFLFAWLLLS